MSDESDNREGWTGMGIWWMSSAALIAAVVIGLAIVLFLPGNDTNTTGNPTPSTDPTTPPSSSASSSPTSSAGTGWEAAGCNPSTGSDGVPGTAPDATWDPVGGSSVPVSTTYGPTQINGAVRQCFEHSPTGALFAAATIAAAIGADPTQTAAVARAQLVPGPGRDQVIQDAENASSSDAFAQTVAAYRFTSCSPDRCNLDMVFTVNGGQLARTALSAVWSGSDWLLDTDALLAGGVAGVEQIPAGFTSWAPGR
ncbi:MAG: hypothetical protein ACRDPS_16575 [Nocardioides sp.]|uniref:hypothetical protein n=1 Tax=Nocardioides sp. TaxID=35761 RepID=UPI003D6BA4C0